MAVSAPYETGLPLDTFAALLGIHPLHFNQIQVAGLHGCGEVWLSHDWQKPSAVSRESVAQAIKQAEDDLEEFLGFPVYPKWYSDVKVTNDPHGYIGPLVLPKAHYIMGGVRTLTLIDAEASITYEDLDDDTYAETATVTVSTDVLDVNEIAVFYPGELGDTDWQIKPIKVTIDSGAATIILNRHDLVLKKELETLLPGEVNGLDDTKFLESVDVYRIYNNPGIQAELHGECSVCGVSGTCTACQFRTYTACLKAEDHKASIVQVQPATYTDNAWTGTSCWNVGPIYDTRLWFKAGWTGPNIWDQAVAYLALTRMPLGLCACPTAKDKIEWWATDMSRSDRTATYKVPKFAEECPWGYSRGAMFAYSIAAKHRMPQGRH